MNDLNKTPLFGVKPTIMISKNVAIVGNSDKLLEKDWSKTVDKYDDVIRFNFANIKLKGQFTGTKTTIRWINCNINVLAAQEHDLSVKTVEHLKKYINRLFTNVKIIAWDSLKDKLLTFNKSLIVHKPNGLCTLENINSYLEQLGVTNRFEERPNCWPRTGFHAILTCIKSGCTPHLYGFDLAKKKQISHYSLNQKYIVSKITCHQVEKEIDILNELIKKEYVKCF